MTRPTLDTLTQRLDRLAEYVAAQPAEPVVVPLPKVAEAMTGGGSSPPPHKLRISMVDDTGLEPVTSGM